MSKIKRKRLLKQTVSRFPPGPSISVMIGKIIPFGFSEPGILFFILGGSDLVRIQVKSSLILRLVFHKVLLGYIAGPLLFSVYEQPTPRC